MSVKYEKITLPNIVIAFAIVPGIFYAIFIKTSIRDIVISLLSPVLVSVFNFVIELLALTFGLFCNQNVNFHIWKLTSQESHFP